MKDINKPFLYRDGIKKIVQTLSGNERIHLGIRPYGFHAGNSLALVGYPHILCREFENAQEKKANFTFIVSINDWEQDHLDGPDYRTLPFNIYPKNTTIQNLYQADGKVKTVDYWQPILEQAVKYGVRQFPKVTCEFYRNSELLKYTEYRDLLFETIMNPKKQAGLYIQYSGKQVLSDPVKYASPVCSTCKKVDGETTIDTTKNEIHFKCNSCDISRSDHYALFDYWWYHKPLFIGRMLVYDIDIALSGGDHYSEGDFLLRKKFLEEYAPTTKIPKMIFTPTLNALKKQGRMSKSRLNTSFPDLDKIILLANTIDNSEVNITKDHILEIDEKGFRNYIFNLDFSN